MLMSPTRSPRTMSLAQPDRIRRVLVAGAVGVCLWVGIEPASAQEITSARPGELPYVVTRVDEPIVVDGRMNEAAWLAIEPLPVYTHAPTFGASPTQRSEFRLAYDSEYLYFSCQSYDSDPDGIRVFSLLRDERSFRSGGCSHTLNEPGFAYARDSEAVREGYSKTDNAVIANLRFRYNPREGNASTSSGTRD